MKYPEKHAKMIMFESSNLSTLLREVADWLDANKNENVWDFVYREDEGGIAGFVYVWDAQADLKKENGK